VISPAAGRDDREDHADAERKRCAQDYDSRELTKEQRQHRHDEHRRDLLRGAWVVHTRREHDAEGNTDQREERRFDEHREDPTGVTRT
jgi:hypothetical protein